MPEKSELIQIPVASTVESALLKRGAGSLLLCIVPSWANYRRGFSVSLYFGEKRLSAFSQNPNLPLRSSAWFELWLWWKVSWMFESLKPRQSQSSLYGFTYLGARELRFSARKPVHGWLCKYSLSPCLQSSSLRMWCPLSHLFIFFWQQSPTRFTSRNDLA